MTIAYEQYHHDWLPAVFGCENRDPPLQYVGAIEAREGRCVTFPNVLQHQVQPFELADPTNPGHRKILALFLIDPNIQIISTSNIPCQQREWWTEQWSSKADGATATDVFGRLPAELRLHILEGVDDFPMGLKEAKKLREELMEERKSFNIANGQAFNGVSISLCEH